MLPAKRLKALRRRGMGSAGEPEELGELETLLWGTDPAERPDRIGGRHDGLGGISRLAMIHDEDIEPGSIFDPA